MSSFLINVYLGRHELPANDVVANGWCFTILSNPPYSDVLCRSSDAVSYGEGSIHMCAQYSCLKPAIAVLPFDGSGNASATTSR